MLTVTINGKKEKYGVDIWGWGYSCANFSGFAQIANLQGNDDLMVLTTMDKDMTDKDVFTPSLILKDATLSCRRIRCCELILENSTLNCESLVVELCSVHFRSTINAAKSGIIIGLSLSNNSSVNSKIIACGEDDTSAHQSWFHQHKIQEIPREVDTVVECKDLEKMNKFIISFEKRYKKVIIPSIIMQKCTLSEIYNCENPMQLASLLAIALMSNKFFSKDFSDEPISPSELTSFKIPKEIENTLYEHHLSLYKQKINSDNPSLIRFCKALIDRFNEINNNKEELL